MFHLNKQLSGDQSRPPPQFTRVREVSLVQLRCRNGAEQIDVKVVDLGRSFNAVGRGSVGGDVERLVGVLRIVEVVRDGQLVHRGEVPINLCEKRIVVDLMENGQSLIRISGCLDEVNKGEPLAIRAAVNQRLVSQDRWSSYRAWRADWRA